MKLLRATGILVLVILSACAWTLLAQGDPFRGLVSRSDGAAPLAFMAVYAVAAVAGIPGSVMTAAGGALFGAAAGALWSLLGATLGAVASFLVSRHLFSGWVLRRAGGNAARVMEGVDAAGWRFVALVRMVPWFPFNATNYLLGVTRVGLVPYAVTTLICMAPGALAYALLGQAGAETSRGGAASVRTFSLALGLLAGLLLLPGILRRAGARSREARHA